MAGVRGDLSWGFQPLDWSNSNLAGAFPGNGLQRINYLMGVHSPLRYQIQWSNALDEDENASADNWASNLGDLIKVVFDVQVCVDNATWETIGTIKKEKDIANRNYATGGSSNVQRFTIDVAPLVADELSYSLCPINKGTWQSNYYGGMNGGAVMQDNVLGNSGTMGNYVSWFNISKNGSFRRLRVVAGWEVVNGDGHVVSASTTSKYSNEITVINSTSQFEKYDVFLRDYNIRNNEAERKFLTRNPYEGVDIKKPVRMDEAAEFLQFHILTARWDDINGAGDDNVGSIGFKVETFDASGAENTFYIRDFEDNLNTELSSTATPAASGNFILSNNQFQNCIQNVSPYYIKNTATAYAPPDGSDTVFPYWEAYGGDTITDDTIYYKVSLTMFGSENQTLQKSSIYKCYVIDREDEKIPYGFVRFHWLNSLGGTDSYTAKRDISEGLTISRDVVERNSVDRTWYQTGEGANDLRISDTMRGGDLYKGGREVSNVNAERNLSVYTEPLNTMTAKWLEEIMLSPNVWVEMDTDATARANEIEPYLRPSTKGYIPVIITNSDVETVNQEQGLVRFNIDYTLAHKVITQRT